MYQTPYSKFSCLLLVLTASFIGRVSAQQFSLKDEVNTFYFSDSKHWSVISGDEQQKKFAAHPEYGIIPWNASCENCYEDLSQRTETSRYFVTDIGEGYREFSVQKSYGSMHYKDARGNWISFDKRLRKVNSHLFRVVDPEFPIEIDIKSGWCQMKNGDELLRFNAGIELIAENIDGSRISLGKANWSDFSAGDQGVLVRNCWPGIDMQMIVYRGAIKTNFILNTRLAQAYRSITFRDHLDFSGRIDKQGLVFASTDPIDLRSPDGKSLFSIGTLAVYDQQNLQGGIEFPFSIAGNQVDMTISGEWLNDPDRKFPVIIDPLVSASNSTPQSSILGSKYSSTCWDDYCAYDMNVPVPPNCTVTDARFSMTFRATSPCVLRDGAMRFTTGSCISPGNGNWWNCANNIFTSFSPGTCQGVDYTMFNDVGSCFRPPQCASYDMPFQFRFARCNDTSPGCTGNCVGAEVDWKVEIRGRTIEVHPSQPAPLPPSTRTICPGDSALLAVEGIYGVAPYTFSWSSGSSTGQTTKVSPSTNTTYTATVTDACGITATKNFNIVVTQATPPDFTFSENPTCINTPVTITAGGSGPIIAYDWTLPGAVTPLVNDLKIHTAQYSSPGIYDVTLNYKQGSCIFPLTKQIEIVTPGQGPSATITSDPPMPVCTGVNVTYFAHAEGAGANPSYQWLVNGNPVGTNSNSYVAFSLAAGDIVQVKITASLSCITPNTGTSAPYVVSIAPPENPTVSISMNPSGSVCPGTEISFTANATNAGLNPSYQWFVNNTMAGTGGDVFTSNTLSHGDQVKVMVTSSSPCSAIPTATSAPLNINLLPVKSPSVSIAATPTGAVCEGTPITFKATPVNGGTAPVYNWKLNGASISGVSGATYTSSAIQDGDVISVELVSNEPCPGSNPAVLSNELTIRVLPKVTPSVTLTVMPGNSICAGTSVTFTSSVVNGGANPGFQWLLNGNPVNGAINASFTRNTLNNGDKISLRLQSSEQCPEPATVLSDVIVMEVTPTLTAGVNISTLQQLPVCEGVAVDFTSTGTNLGPNPVYTWSINGNNLSQNESDINIPIPANGDLIRLSVSPDGPCYTSNEAVSNTISLQILPYLSPSVSIDANPSDTVCKNTYEMQFIANAVNAGQNPSYAWSLNGAPDGPDAPVYTNQWIKAGDQVEVELTSNYSCKTEPTAKSNQILVKGHAPITVDAGVDQEICLDQTITLSATANGGKSGHKSYLWHPGNMSGNQVTIAPKATTTYMVEVTDLCGSFIAYDSVKVIVNPKPNTNFSWSPQEPILLLNPEITFHNQNTIPVSHQWDFGDGSSSTEAAPVHTYGVKGAYTVKLYVTTDKGCKDTRTAIVNVKDIFVFYIPNSFTPNGDGLNDRFEFYFNDSIPYSFQVFNRWGQMVFNGDEKTEFWDGRDKSTGKYVQDDVYVYQLIYRKKGPGIEEPLVTLHGYITVYKFGE